MMRAQTMPNRSIEALDLTAHNPPSSGFLVDRLSRAVNNHGNRSIVTLLTSTAGVNQISRH
jgi:hypothetical protein